MKKRFGIATAVVAAAFLAGCGGGGSSDTTADASGATTYDVTVERGPVLHAVVVDHKGKRARERGRGHYAFDGEPAYPVYASGGIIDVDRDGNVSEGDVNNTMVLLCPEGKAATVVSTVATRSEVRAWLKERYGLTDEEIDNATPGTDRTIAAVSDEVYAYCVEHNITDPARLTLEEMERLQNRIASRIQEYKATDTPVSVLEEQLVEELNLPVFTREQAEAFHRGQGNAGVGGAGNGHAGAGMDGIVDAVLAMPDSNLTEEQKHALAYMWNEEKLAKDIYLALNDLHPHNTLYNIATRSETQHEAAVEALVKKYDINITNLEDYEVSYSEEELRALAPGQYAIPEVQELYDTLYAEGNQSLTDALEVGCKVEVTDVNDLDEYLEVAEGAPDLVTVFTSLRSGSYNHYWAFDRALKALGVEEGCCALGEAFCKTPEEYPASNGSGNGQGPQDGTGMGNGYHGGQSW